MDERRERRPRIAYLTMGFPVRSETAVVREMYAIQQDRFDVFVFSVRPLTFEGIYEPKADTFRGRAFGLNAERVAEAAWATFKRALRGDRGFYRALGLTLRHSGKMLPKTLPVLVLAAGFADRAQALGIEYLHGNFAALQGYAAWAIHQMTGIPYGFTMHAYDLFEQGFMIPEKVQDGAVVVSISEFNLRYIQEKWGVPRDGIHIIRCGVDVSEFTPVDRVRGEELRLLTVGRLHPMKGFPHLIEAMSLLGKDFPARLDIIGAGDERDRLLARIKELGLEDRVAIHSGIPQDQLRELYRRADVYVQPSVPAPSGTMDGVPATLMEAMAVALPCISTRLSGIPELVIEGHTGLLVEPGNAAQLAEAIRWMERHPEQAVAMGRRGRAKVEGEYDADANGRRLGEVIAKTLGATAAAAGRARAGLRVIA